MAKERISFEVRRTSSSKKVIVKGSGGKDAKSTLQVAREKLGSLVKRGKIKEGVLRCSVIKDGKKADEWNISAKAKNAPVRKVRKASAKKAS